MFSAIRPFVKRAGVAVAAVLLVWLAVGGAFAQDPPDKHDAKVSPLLRELLASAQAAESRRRSGHRRQTRMVGAASRVRRAPTALDRSRRRQRMSRRMS